MIESVTIIRRFGDFTFDATFSEQHNSTLDVTDIPVESGVIISDNAVIKPKVIKIEAGVSDVKLRESVDDPFEDGDRRSTTAWRLLVELQESREPFSVATGLKLYENMLITSLSATQADGSDQVLEFTAELKEVKFVETQEVRYPPRAAGSTHRQASKAKAKGEQQGKREESEETSTPAKKKTLLKDLTTKGSGVLSSAKSFFFGGGK